MKKLILLSFLIACICAHPQKYNFNVKINEIKSQDYPHIKEELSNGISGRDLDDCTLNALFNQTLMNLCADEVFAEVDTYVADNYDPLSIPDEEAGFSYTLIITYEGSINLTNGNVSEVSTVHRDGNVTISVDIFTQDVNLSLPLAFNNLDIKYDYRAEIMGLGPTGGVEGHVSNLELALSLSYDNAAKNITLNSVDLVNEGDIDIEFSGNSLVDWLLDLLSDAVTTIFKQQVQNLVQTVVRDAAEAAVDALNEALASGTTEAPSGLAQHIYKETEQKIL